MCLFEEYQDKHNIPVLSMSAVCLKTNFSVGQEAKQSPSRAARCIPVAASTIAFLLYVQANPYQRLS